MLKEQYQISVWLICIKPVYAENILKVSAPPSIWVQQQGDVLIGPMVELLDEIFAGFNIVIKPQELPWARAIDQMKSGKLDMIPIIFYTSERAKYMDFTISFMEVHTAVFVPPGKPFPFKTVRDLKGRQGLMMREDSISAEFEAFESELNIVKVAKYEQIFNMLGSNRVDYAVAAQYGFLIHARKLGYLNMFEVLPVPVATRKLYFAFSKKSRFIKYIPAINSKLKQLKDNGTIDKIVDKAIRQAAGK